ncbi:MAG TPA: glutamate formimidoyltransferase [Cyanobacteria bacterium UBA8530]|nr:glutamate formimidoyltransferase [Cyanobacteria bacterium UBA8530]
MAKLIECVPNISEGRREEVIEACVKAVSTVPGVVFLNKSSDPDHNRTVLTLVGNPEGLKQAIINLYETAVAKIDLRNHQGEHPRMGAVDVVPFIPLQEVTTEECVLLAKEVAEEVARRFDIPVFLYEDAAASLDRKNLAAIRKGQFEGMAEKMKNPQWKPDFGPNQPHPSAGVTAIGARFFLVAYNVQLGTADLKIADTIAKSVRAISGGLSNVKAMGVFLEDRQIAQVSMNLVNYKKTPIYRIQELVKAEAKRWGVPVIGSEIIGLVPQEALLDSAAYYLQIENYHPSLILENQVAEAAHE